MTAAVPHLFADIKSLAEEAHALANEGQCPDNAADMQRVLVSQLCMTFKAMDGKMGEIKERLSDGHD